MKLKKTKFKGLKVIKLKRNNDKRGYLAETYNKKIVGGKDLIFDYKVISKKNIFRGFHFQYKFQQVKLISVLKGKILDCVIDLRKNSKTFGETYLNIEDRYIINSKDLTYNRNKMLVTSLEDTVVNDDIDNIYNFEVCGFLNY